MSISKEQFQIMEDSSDNLNLILTSILVVLVKREGLELSQVIGEAKQALHQSKHIKRKE